MAENCYNYTSTPPDNCPILPLDSQAWVAFNALRFIYGMFTASFAVYALWRFAVVFSIKYDSANWQTVAKDAQLHTLLLCAASFICMCLSFTIHYYILAVDLLSSTMGSLSFAFGTLAVARTTFFFVRVHSRFHPNSRYAANALATVSLIFLVLFFVIIGKGDQQLEHIVNIVYIVSLVAFLATYALAVLRAPEDPNVLRAHRAAERETRHQLIRIVKVALSCACLLAFLIGLAASFPTYAMNTWIRFPESFAACGGLFLLVLLMGRAAVKAPVVPERVSVKSARTRGRLSAGNGLLPLDVADTPTHGPLTQTATPGNSNGHGHGNGTGNGNGKVDTPSPLTPAQLNITAVDHESP